MKDSTHSGRPFDFDKDRLNVLIHNDPRQSNRELASVVDSDQSTVVSHLHSMGKVEEMGV